MNPGALAALASAFLFGVSPVLAKALSSNVSPIWMASLLYLGSGIALSVVWIRRPKEVLHHWQVLSRKNRWKAASAIFAGGVLAPLCLTVALSRGTAFEISLLLNFESVATTLLAFFLFREHVGFHVWAG